MWGGNSVNENMHCILIGTTFYGAISKLAYGGVTVVLYGQLASGPINTADTRSLAVKASYIYPNKG